MIGTRSAGIDVALFNQDTLDTAQGKIPSDTCARDSGTDDQYLSL
jgi:hypothetical protein